MNEDSLEIRSLDGPPVDALEDLFELPPHLAENPTYVRWHREFVNRLRSEASGVPMRVIQYALMERIATSYIAIRASERENPSRSPRERREDNASLNSMMQEFNRLLEKHNDKVVNELKLQVKDMLDGILSTIPDVQIKQSVRRQLAEGFASMDL